MAFEAIRDAFATNESHPLQIASTEELTEVLERFGVDHTLWGCGPTKTVEQLFAEVQNNESRLLESGEVLGRVVSVACIRIATEMRGTRYELLETRQVFKNRTDGPAERRRMQPLAEKVLGNEDPRQAALRGIREELGIDYPGELVVQPTTLQVTESSASYPGLLSVYCTFPFAAEFAAAEYRADGYREEQPDKITYFEWLNADDVAPAGG